jgi:AraC-like DNA-binding protein
MTGIAAFASGVPEGTRASLLADDRELAAGDVVCLTESTFARLIVAVRGPVTITTCERLFVLNASGGLWLPAGQGCRVVGRGAACVRMVAFDRPAASMPMVAQVFVLSPLVYALIVAMTAGDDPRCGTSDRDGALVTLLLQELSALPERPVRITLPRDPRLRRVCEAIVARPADDRGIDEWSREAGMARRTFTQSFRDETGMAFAGWRRQVRLAEAAERIAAGQPIGRVAYDLGYESSSAFTAMFRRTLGAAPTQWMRRN